MRGSKLELDPDMLIGPQEAQYKVLCEVYFHLQLALVLRVLVLYFFLACELIIPTMSKKKQLASCNS